MSFKFEFGNKVRDIVTGFEGTIISRVEYITGCIQYGIKPKVKDDGKMPESEYIDESQLELIEEETKKKSSRKPPGGPSRDCPKF